MNNSKTGIVLIDAPSGAGKTRFIKEMGAKPSNTLTSEQLMDMLMQMCRDKVSLEGMADKLQHIYYVENLESLSGREETQCLAARVVMQIAMHHRVFVTGINFRERLPFFMALLNAYEFMPLPN